jgi:outer membrane protein assembly factor BamD (BamD/ComL family)
MLVPMTPSARAAVPLLLLAATAVGQVKEYTLDPATGAWVAAPAPALTPDQRVMAEARQALADGRPGAAIRALDAWIDQNGTSVSPLLPQAYLLRADAKTASGDEYDALYDYERLLIDYPGTEEFTRGVERELEIGLKYLGGLKRRWLGMRIVPAEDVVEELLVRVQERTPGSRLAERAGIELADYYYRNRDLKLAADAYEIFIANFPTSPSARHAREYRIYANIGRFKGPDYDASALAEAKVLIEEFTEIDPAAARRAGLSDALVARLNESMAAQLVSKAEYYLRRQNPVAARHALQRAVKAFPQTVAATRAMAMLKERQWPLAASLPEPPSQAPAQAPDESAAPDPATPAAPLARPEGAP